MEFSAHVERHARNIVQINITVIVIRMELYAMSDFTIFLFARNKSKIKNQIEFYFFLFLSISFNAIEKIRLIKIIKKERQNYFD